MARPCSPYKTIGALPWAVWESINPFVASYLFIVPISRLDLWVWHSPWRKCPYKEQTSWARKWGIKEAVWERADKKLGRDLWTLNPAHLWTRWPQCLSQRGKHRGNWCSETDTPFRLEERGNQEQQTVLKNGPSESWVIKGSARLLLASMCEERLCVARRSRHLSRKVPTRGP